MLVAGDFFYSKIISYLRRIRGNLKNRVSASDQSKLSIKVHKRRKNKIMEREIMIRKAARKGKKPEAEINRLLWEDSLPG